LSVLNMQKHVSLVVFSKIQKCSFKKCPFILVPLLIMIWKSKYKIIMAWNCQIVYHKIDYAKTFIWVSLLLELKIFHLCMLALKFRYVIISHYYMAYAIQVHTYYFHVLIYNFESLCQINHPHFPKLGQFSQFSLGNTTSKLDIYDYDKYD
jgi:hypothetical protein